MVVTPLYFFKIIFAVPSWFRLRH